MSDSSRANERRPAGAASEAAKPDLILPLNRETTPAQERFDALMAKADEIVLACRSGILVGPLDDDSKHLLDLLRRQRKAARESEKINTRRRMARNVRRFFQQFEDEAVID